MFFILGGDGKEYGPSSVGKIQEWIAGGRANLQTKARRADDPEWRTLGDFPEFGAPPPPAAPTGEPPPMAAGISPAPTHGGELEPADRGARLLAAILDTVIGLIALSPGLGLMVAAGAFNEPDPDPNTPLLIAGGCALILGTLALLAVQLYLLVTNGQTLGKKIVRVKIVSFESGENPGFVKTVLLRAVVNGLIGGIPVVGGIYTLVDICFIFRDDRRCIHDLIAGTMVVKA